MKKIKLLGFCFLFSLSSSIVAQINSSDDISSIQSTLKAQENAWNQGDLESFMKGYWKSDDLSFVDASGISYGWEQVLSNYKKSYPSKEKMGILSFDIKQITALSDKSYMVLGKYSLERRLDTPTGYFSLIWKKINGNWKIINDHTSASVTKS